MADMDQGIKRLLEMRTGEIIAYILPGARLVRP
jgi:hypothetical protein